MQQAAIAPTQYQITAGDLDVVLALARGQTLARAGERLGLDGSTVFRALQRLERGLGQRVFDRTRAGYEPTALARQLAAHAEQVEAALEAARSAVASGPGQAAGQVRITATDTVLHGLLAPALGTLTTQHPLLQVSCHTGNALVNLTRRDADLAVRATRRPPAHLVGRCLGTIRVAVYGPRTADGQDGLPSDLAAADWIAPDDALPDHPSVAWRRRHVPKAVPRYQVDSILSVCEFIALGLGVGIVPLFLADGRPDLQRLTEPLDGAETALWLLTHPEARHLPRVAAVYTHLATQVTLP